MASARSKRWPPPGAFTPPAARSLRPAPLGRRQAVSAVSARLPAWSLGVAIFGGAVWPLPARAAEPWAADPAPCARQATTLDIVACLDERTRFWDARLNQAYGALVGTLQGPDDTARLAQLKIAQRAWLQYRDADCGYYGKQQGTIRGPEVGRCLLDLTQARAVELHEDGPQ